MANDEMKVITVMTRKGGAGKTTLTRALMSAAMQRGKRCLLVDTDPQQALARWATKLKIEDPFFELGPRLDSAAGLADLVESTYEAGETDLVFVDTIGAAGDWADILAIDSDALVVPMMLSDDDFEITKDTFNWYVGLRERTDDPELLPTFHVVLSNVPSKQSKAEEAVEHEAIRSFPVAEDYFMSRKQHKDAAQGGFLHHLAAAKRASRNGLTRFHARHYEEALEEAGAILDQVMGAN